MSPKVSKTKSKAATAVADPTEATKTRIIQILQDRGRTNVYEIACEAGLSEDTVLPILMRELADMIEVVQANEDDDEGEGEARTKRSISA